MSMPMPGKRTSACMNEHTHTQLKLHLNTEYNKSINIIAKERVHFGLKRGGGDNNKTKLN